MGPWCPSADCITGPGLKSLLCLLAAQAREERTLCTASAGTASEVTVAISPHMTNGFRAAGDTGLAKWQARSKRTFLCAEIQ